MSVSTVVRDARAQANYLKHRALGHIDNLLFSNSGEAAVTLSGNPGGHAGAHGKAIDLDADLTEREFEIAKQTNFPPTDGIREGAQIWFPATVTDYYWEVQSWNGEDMASDDVAAVYKVQARRTQVRRLR